MRHVACARLPRRDGRTATRVWQGKNISRCNTDENHHVFTSSLPGYLQIPAGRPNGFIKIPVARILQKTTLIFQRKSVPVVFQKTPGLPRRQNVGSSANDWAVITSEAWHLKQLEERRARGSKLRGVKLACLPWRPYAWFIVRGQRQNSFQQQPMHRFLLAWVYQSGYVGKNPVKNLERKHLLRM